MSSRQPPAPSGASPVAVLLAFAAIYLIWGSTFLAIRVAVAEVPPLLMAGARMVVAGAVLYGLARHQGVARPTASEWRRAALVGSLMFLVGNGALAWSEQRLPSGVAALICATIPMWAVLLEAAATRRAPGARVVAGLVLGLGGIAALVGGGSMEGTVHMASALVLLAGTLAWSVGSTPAVSRGVPASHTMSAAAQLLAGGALLLLSGLLAGERLAGGGVSARALLAIGYLVVFGSLLGFSAYNWLLGVAAPSRVATYAFVNPLVAVVLGWAIGGERIAPRELAAGAAVVAAVVLIVTGRRAAARAGSVPAAPAPIPAPAD